MITIIHLLSTMIYPPINAYSNIEEVHHLAAILSAEAIPGDRADMLAVGTVIMNRVSDTGNEKHPDDILGVISAPGQFSGYLSDLYQHPQPIHYQVAREIINGGARAFGSEVLYFINPRHSTDTIFVAWVMAQELVASYHLEGSDYIHNYYKEIK